MSIEFFIVKTIATILFFHSISYHKILFYFVSIHHFCLLVNLKSVYFKAVSLKLEFRIHNFESTDFSIATIRLSIFAIKSLQGVKLDC